MSLLSKSHYTKLCLNLQTLHEQLSQQSKNIQNKISLTLCKIDCIKQAIEQENQQYLHQGADWLMQGREIVGEFGEVLGKVREKYRNSVKAVMQDLNKQLADIETTASQLKSTQQSQHQTLLQSLTQTLQSLLQQSTQYHQSHLSTISTLQKKLLDQLHQCQQQILKNRKEMQQDQTTLIEKIGEIGLDLEDRVGKLEEERKRRKNGFLDLLEGVVEKVQDLHM